MKIFTDTFGSEADLDKDIETRHKEAKAKGQEIKVLEKYSCKERCTGRVNHFAELEVPEAE